MTIIFQKSVFIFSCAQLLQIWVSCVVIGTPVWLEEAHPLDTTIAAPVPSRICWHSRLLCVLLSQVTWHPPGVCKRFQCIFSHTTASPGTQSCVPQWFSAVRGRGAEEVRMHFRISYMKSSENTRVGSHAQASWIRCWVGESLKKLLGWWRSDKHSHILPAQPCWVNEDLDKANGRRWREGPGGGGAGMTQRWIGSVTTSFSPQGNLKPTHSQQVISLQS